MSADGVCRKEARSIKRTSLLDVVGIEVLRVVSPISSPAERTGCPDAAGRVSCSRPVLCGFPAGSAGWIAVRRTGFPASFLCSDPADLVDSSLTDSSQILQGCRQGTSFAFAMPAVS